MEPTSQTLLADYQPSAATVELVGQTPIVLLVGISGAGKDTIKHHLMQTDKYHHIVSHTTRQPRQNAGIMETNGIEYHFISLDDADRMLTDGLFIEAKMIHGTVYGTSVAELEASHQTHKVALTDLDVQGVAEYKAMSDNVIAIFVLPPNFDEWQRRLRSRYADNGQNEAAEIKTRMQTAIGELEKALQLPYYHFVINDDLDQAVEIVDKIAHNHDEFNTIDDAVRAQAEKLLNDLMQSI